MDLKKLIDKMSLKEKLYQLMQLDSNVIIYDENMPVTGPLQKLNVDEKYIFETGSLVNSFGAARTIEIQKNFLENSKNKIPVVIMQDVIRGYRTLYPINLGLSCSFDTELCEEFWMAFVREAKITLHVDQLAGKNSHHIIEGVFKAVARALGKATAKDEKRINEIPSTKGVL